MATSTEKTEAYRNVVMALARAAELDGFTERADIALAMDALGATIANICPMVEAQAIRFRNGPLLCDYQPVSEYLRKDPEPLTILVEYDWILGAIRVKETVELTIINYAKAILLTRKPDEFAKLTDSWWAKVEVTDIGYLVTFHYDQELP